MIELLLLATLLGQELTVGQPVALNDAVKGHPIELCWKVNLRGAEQNSFCDAYCGDLPVSAPDAGPRCQFTWTPGEAGVWEVTLIAYYLHQDADESNYVANYTQLANAVPAGALFSDGFESGDISGWGGG